MNESCLVNLVHNKTTKLAMLFALVGAMMIVVPMLTEQVYARTLGNAWTRISHSEPTFANVKGHLDAGKWVKFPILLGNGRFIEWMTT